MHNYTDTVVFFTWQDYRKIQQPYELGRAGNGNTKIAEMIFQFGLTPDDAGNYENNPVEIALRYSKIDTAIYLINKGVKPEGLGYCSILLFRFSNIRKKEVGTDRCSD